MNIDQVINHEKQIIGCIAFPDSSPEAVACCAEMRLTEECLSDPFHRQIFGLVQAMSAAKMPVYPYSVVDYAKKSGQTVNLKQLGSIIDEITVGLPYLKSSIEAIKQHDYANRSELLIKQSLMQIRDGDPVEAVRSLKASLVDLEANQLPRSNNLGHITDYRADKIEQWKNAKGVGFVGIPSGIPEINKYLGGYRRKVMTILGGYRGEGKSTIMRQELFYQAKAGFKTLMITLEDPVEVCNAAIAGNHADISIYGLDTGTGNPDNIEKINKAWASLKDVPMRIASARTIDDVVSLIAVCKARYGLDCAGIDHIQHIAPYVMRGLDRNGTMGSYSGAICYALKEHDVAGIVASQFSRDGEKQARRPRLSDLRDSGCLEQDARAALLLSKDGDCHILEVAKNSYGPSGNEIRLVRNGGAQRFEEIKTPVAGKTWV